MSELRRLDVRLMVSEPPPPVPWRISHPDGGGLVVDGGLTMLNGREGEGKSALSLALAAGVAMGQSEAGYACSRGRVLILDAENGEAEIHRRVHAFGLPSEGVEVYEVDQFDLRRDLGSIVELVRVHGPAFLVLDSWRSLWVGDENDSGQVSQALDPLRKLAHLYRVGVLLLHHSNRASGDYRGNSAIGGCVDLGFKLAREQDDEDADRRYVHCWKCRVAREPPRRWLRMSMEGGGVFIESAEAPVGTERAPRAPVRADLIPQVRAVLTDEPKSRAAIARAVGRDPKDRSVGRVIDGLVNDREAEKVATGWRKVAGGSPPIGPRHPATLGQNHGQTRENAGGKSPVTGRLAATPVLQLFPLNGGDPA